MAKAEAARLVGGAMSREIGCKLTSPATAWYLGHLTGYVTVYGTISILLSSLFLFYFYWHYFIAVAIVIAFIITIRILLLLYYVTMYFLLWK